MAKIDTQPLQHLFDTHLALRLHLEDLERREESVMNDIVARIGRLDQAEREPTVRRCVQRAVRALGRAGARL